MDSDNVNSSSSPSSSSSLLDFLPSQSSITNATETESTAANTVTTDENPLNTRQQQQQQQQADEHVVHQSYSLNTESIHVASSPLTRAQTSGNPPAKPPDPGSNTMRPSSVPILSSISKFFLSSTTNSTTSTSTYSTSPHSPSSSSSTPMSKGLSDYLSPSSAANIVNNRLPTFATPRARVHGILPSSKMSCASAEMSPTTRRFVNNGGNTNNNNNVNNNGNNNNARPFCNLNLTMPLPASAPAAQKKLFWPNVRVIFSIFIASVFVCTLTFFSISRFSSTISTKKSTPESLLNVHNTALNASISQPAASASAAAAAAVVVDSSMLKKLDDGPGEREGSMDKVKSGDEEHVAKGYGIAREMHNQKTTDIQEEDESNSSSITNTNMLPPAVTKPVTLTPASVAVAAETTSRNSSRESEDGQVIEDGSAKTPHNDPTDMQTFSKNTCLNYFHLHKTGGVSIKEKMYAYFTSRNRSAAGGIFDTCHERKRHNDELGIESVWSCDLRELEAMSRSDVAKINVVIGHQYWEKGSTYFADRDVRYFTIFRHPLHRKISFYYHFFVRNLGLRDEANVSVTELKHFILNRASQLPKSIRNNNLLRDAGPNYYASRMWSDGWHGFTANRFEIAKAAVVQGAPTSVRGDTLKQQEAYIVKRSIQRLKRRFVFVGLQTQERASLCMLKRVVHAFSKAHGVANLDGIDKVATQKERLNSGSYSLDARRLWEAMSESERAEYKVVESVDLQIYKQAVELFKGMVEKFGCQQDLEKTYDDDIALD